MDIRETGESLGVLPERGKIHWSPGQKGSTLPSEKDFTAGSERTSPRRGT